MVNQPGAGPEHAPDERLLAEFLGGDHRAFERLVSRYSDDLFRFVARFIRSPAAAEDVVQETFIQVYQSAGGFDPSRRFRPWLFTIAANKARDQLRVRLRRKELPLGAPAGDDGDGGGPAAYLDFLADEGAAPDQALLDDEQRERVGRIVSQMPDTLREVLVLGYYHRFPYKEIADILSIPLGTVKSRLHAAVACFAKGYMKLEQAESAGAETND